MVPEPPTVPCCLELFHFHLITGRTSCAKLPGIKDIAVEISPLLEDLAKLSQKNQASSHFED